MTPSTPAALGFDPGLLVAAFAIALVVAILGFLVVTTYNDVVGLRLRIDKAWSNIDVVLRQRFDQLPGVLLAGIFGWRERVFFKADAAVHAAPSAANLA